MLSFKEKGCSKQSTAAQHLGSRSIYFFLFQQMSLRGWLRMLVLARRHDDLNGLYLSVKLLHLDFESVLIN